MRGLSLVLVGLWRCSEMVRDRVEVDRVAEHVWVVALLGEHDLSTADAVRGAIDEVFASGSRVVLDLSDASFIDSTVLAALVEAYNRAQQQEDDEIVVVARPGSAPRRVLDLAQVALRIDVYESRELALAAVLG
jgi:anti-sigma B factor antagonist